VRRPAALFALVLALAGCTETQDPTIEAGGDPAAPATSNPSFTGAPIAPPISAPPVDPRAYLTAVRASSTAGGGSRVVFEFDPLVPGYTIDFAERPITEDGSGDEVEVDGEAVLSVRMENAGGARIEGERVIPTYTGPDRVPATGDPAVVTEVVDTGDFEGVVTWAVGLRAKVPAISVSTFAEPHRLVIDVPAATGG
jgi:hypothetical protein